MRRVLLVSAVFCVLAAPSAMAACPPAAEVDRFVADWLALKPTAAPGGAELSATDAACARDMVVERLEGKLGKVVGYKAGLTSKAVQERFGATEPARGTLLEGMMVKGGATVPAAFGARPLYEADLILAVRDAGVNDAATPEEVLSHLSAIYPFIELPDLVVPKEHPLTGTVLTAINVGARKGVLGTAIPIDPADKALVQKLVAMKVIMADQDGTIISTGTGDAVLGSPLNVVMWVAKNLAASGRKLEAGDLISVGSFSPLTPPKPGQTITVRYEGLPGDPAVSVRFE
jgi:2-keto-4-pentenoate hydratase